MEPNPEPTELAPPTYESLADGLRRLQQEQRATAAQVRRRRRRTQAGRWALIPLALLTILAIAVTPVLYRTAEAYRDVFVDPAPDPAPQFVVAVNADGTRSIVEADPSSRERIVNSSSVVAPTPVPAVGGGVPLKTHPAATEPDAMLAEPPETMLATEPAAPGPSTAETIATMPEWNGANRVTILLIGVDKREDDYSRSDTMILVNIDTARKQAGMLSIPRDLKVIVPGYGIHKMNAAYAFGDANDVPGGGPGLTVRTIEANFGLKVDYFAEVDFAGFEKIVQTVGGLTLDVPYPIKDDAYPGPGNQYMRIFFPAGWQHLNGERVLQYARTRHDDGDASRARRQQQILLALRQQAIDLDLLPKAAQLIAELGGTVRTDIAPKAALQLARLAAEIDPASIQQYSLGDALTEEELPDQPYYLVADWNAVGTILSAFTGTTIVPPMSALSHPDFARPLAIVDRSGNPGLGDRVAAVLRQHGFRQVTVATTNDTGDTKLTTTGADLTTAYLVAGLVGVPLEAIDVSPADTNNGGTIAIVLGSGAADPVDFVPEPFQDELAAEVSANRTISGTPAGDTAGDAAGASPTDDWAPVTGREDGATAAGP